ncbi:MAG: SDR family oxidoreductase [Candidatus Glassbacteria bacterium]|nr:SDR family oxidoreductase [Candidatus Glassbacteria bacterium]
MTEDRFEAIKVGDEAELFHTITAADLDVFVKLTGDDNPLHVDDKFAASTAMKKTAVHGMLTAAFISTVIGTRLPGKGALWYEQTLRFLAPVRVGEKIRVWARVRHKSPAQRVLTLETIVFKESGTKVIEGEAKVKVLKTRVKKKPAERPGARGAVIVTGAGRGIGAAVAVQLAAEGFPVVVNYSKSRAAAGETVGRIEAAKGRAAAFQADVSDRGAVKEMVGFAVETFGTVYGAVNNAAPPVESREFTGLSWEDVQVHLEVQVKGAFNLCREVLPLLLEAQSGVIVNISSIYADNVPPVRLLPYTLSKAALVSLTRSLAVEYGPRGVRVNCVSPGMTDTEFIADLPEKAKMVERMQTPLRRLASPEDVAGVVAFLFSEKAAHLTGENIRVCGGRVMA